MTHINCTACEGEGGLFDYDNNFDRIWIECLHCDGEGIVEVPEDARWALC